MGHSDVETTMIYVHLAGLDVAGDHALHSPVHILENSTAVRRWFERKGNSIRDSLV